MCGCMVPLRTCSMAPEPCQGSKCAQNCRYDDCNIYISSRREHCIKCKATVKEICLLYLLGLLKSFSKCP